jgi:hypothetical protein
MNSMHTSYGRKPAAKDAPKIKTVGWQLGITERNLAAKVKAAFDLARSAGRELNLTFGSGNAGPSTLGQPHCQ